MMGRRFGTVISENYDAQRISDDVFVVFNGKDIWVTSCRQFPLVALSENGWVDAKIDFNDYSPAASRVR